MNFKLLSWLYVIIVTHTEGIRNGSENRVFLKEDSCDVFPQIKCSRDCSSLKVCYDAKMPQITLKCPEDRPFCANGKCGTVNENCGIQLNDDESNFVCTSDGIFPDPTNCTNWYVCVGTTVTQVSCNSGYIFNSKTNECVRGTPRTDHVSKNICRKISCTNKRNGYILFPANPAYYAYCYNDSMLLYKCPDVENQIYDTSSKKCVFNCRAEGYFPDPIDCTVYYFCKSFVSKFKATTLHCAEGHYFDGTKCVIGTNCGNTTPLPTIPTPPTPTPTTDEPTTSDVPTPPTPSPTIPTPPTPAPTTDEPTTSDVPTPPTPLPTVPTPPAPTPTTEDPTTTTNVSPTTSSPFSEAESKTTDAATTSTASTAPPMSTESTIRPTAPTPPPTPSTVQDFENLIDKKVTTKSPNFHQSYSLWKHKGKYSIRLS